MQYKPVEADELMTVQEVAKILRVDTTSARRWIKQGALEAVTLPHLHERRAYRIRRETLDKVLDTRQETV